MVNIDRVVPDGGVATADSSIVGQISESLGVLEWFVLIEAVLLVVAFVLNTVFDLPIVAGLIGALVLLMGVNGALVFVGLLLYRSGN